MLCKNYPVDKRRRTNAGPTLVYRLRRWTNATPKSIQRVVSAGTTYENIESRSPGKNQTTTQSGLTAGPPFRTPAQQQNNIKTKQHRSDDPTPRRHRPRASPAKHEHVQPMSVQCCPIVFDAGPTLQQHRPHASRPPGYAYTGPTNAAPR